MKFLSPKTVNFLFFQLCFSKQTHVVYSTTPPMCHTPTHIGLIACKEKSAIGKDLQSYEKNCQCLEFGFTIIISNAAIGLTPGDSSTSSS